MKNITISPDATIVEAMKKLDNTAEKVLFVIDQQNHLLGSLTDGDIRRYIIRTGRLEGTIGNVYNKNPIKLKEGQEEKIKEFILKYKIEAIPIVNDENMLVNFVVWSEVFKEKKEFKEYKKINIPVVIIAGGKGTRLEPFTKVLPKPLIPVEEKTILEHIIDSFRKFGINSFYLIVNYKSQMIKSYFEGIEKDYHLHFVDEKEFLGTIGGLYYLKNIMKTDFIVSNCDVLLNTDYAEAYDFHLHTRSILTYITCVKHYKIPYGKIDVSNSGYVAKIQEKPELSFQISTGVYFMNPKIFEYFQEKRQLDMPCFTNQLLEFKCKIFAYPINESDFIDIGEWERYKESLFTIRKFFK